jgi:hypothetical protein
MKLGGSGHLGTEGLLSCSEDRGTGTTSGHKTPLQTLTTHLYQHFNIIILSRVSKPGSSVSVQINLCTPRVISLLYYIPNNSSNINHFSWILSTFLSFQIPYFTSVRRKLAVLFRRIKSVFSSQTGYAVTELVLPTCYKPESRRFNSRWCHWNSKAISSDGLNITSWKSKHVAICNLS